MILIEAKNGRHYPANRIVSIGPSEVRRGEGITELELEGVGYVEFYSWRIDAFLRQPDRTLEVQPGTYIVRLDDESPEGIWKTLMVGWSVAQDGKLYPVTVHGVNDLEDIAHFILTPDGRVTQSEGDTWESVEVFVQSHREERAAA